MIRSFRSGVLFSGALFAGVLLSGCADAGSPAAAPAPAGTAAAPTPAGAAAPAAPAAAVRTIDVATLKADIDRAAVPLLIDVRTPEEYAGGHVPGARNIPLDEVGARLAEFGTAEAEVYVICQSGGRSARASTTLAASGLHPVNVSGGTGAWKSAGYPVE